MVGMLVCVGSKMFLLAVRVEESRYVGEWSVSSYVILCNIVCTIMQPLHTKDGRSLYCTARLFNIGNSLQQIILIQIDSPHHN